MHRYIQRSFSLRDRHARRFRNPYYPERYIKGKKRWPKVALFISGAFVVTLLILLIVHPRMRIRAFEMPATLRFASNEEVRAYVDGELRQKIAYLVPRAHLLFVRPSALARSLEETFLFKKVAVKRGWGESKLTIAIEEHTPAAIAQMHEYSFYINNTGHVLNLASPKRPALPPTLPHISVSSTLSSVPARGESAVPEAVLHAVQTFVRTFEKEYPLAFVNFLFDTHDSTKIEAVSSEGWRIYIDPQKEIAPQALRAIVVLKQKFPRPPRKFEYMDVRFGNRIFYQ